MALSAEGLCWLGINCGADILRKNWPGAELVEDKAVTARAAKEIVVSGGAFGSPHLLLLSGIGRPYDPVANTGVVGRNYSYQALGAAILFYEDRVFNNFMGGGGLGTSVDDYNGDNFDHARSEEHTSELQ